MVYMSTYVSIYCVRVITKFYIGTLVNFNQNTLISTRHIQRLGSKWIKYMDTFLPITTYMCISIYIVYTILCVSTYNQWCIWAHMCLYIVYVCTHVSILCIYTLTLSWVEEALVSIDAPSLLIFSLAVIVASSVIYFYEKKIEENREKKFLHNWFSVGVEI